MTWAAVVFYRAPVLASLGKMLLVEVLAKLEAIATGPVLIVIVFVGDHFL